VTFRQLASVLRGRTAGPADRDAAARRRQLRGLHVHRAFLLQRTGVRPTGQRVPAAVRRRGKSWQLRRRAAAGHPNAPTILAVITVLGLSVLAMPLLGLSTLGAFLVLAFWGLSYGALP